MKIGLKAKIEAIITGYKASFETQVKEIKQVIDEWKDQVDKFKLEYIKEQISSGLSEISENYSKVNKVYNQKLKAVIADAKAQILPKEVAKPADYTAKVWIKKMGIH
ncbi:hypothetical protein L9W92_18320 [Pelotomaculum terephthalicicum JT]|uniref:hypothetical protein n=1 Tax=Pelotomaculum terephthalicicum TaxID=206393 RepID=UPI001F0420D1|nr:hypothetical protein [Pelotomaculum terephthalicicum]MCG9969953.1 hypothetical protein [Pelotomaculum terephthalicicum JT]